MAKISLGIISPHHLSALSLAHMRMKTVTTMAPCPRGAQEAIVLSLRVRGMSVRANVYLLCDGSIFLFVFLMKAVG